MTSQLNVDTIVDKAGSGGTNVKVATTSTYVSEGGNVTQNLVQAVAKHFVAYQSDSSTVVLNSQSLNNSSLTDNATGDTVFTFTNNMSQTRYVIPDSGGDNNGGYSTFTVDANMTTEVYRYVTGNDSFSAQDSDFHSCWAIGDLA